MRLIMGASLALAVLATTGAMPAPAAAAETSVRQTGFLDRTVTVDGTTRGYQVYVPRTFRPGLPVILFLHGAGRRGSDGVTPTQEGMGPAIRDNPERFPAIVVFPQAPANGSWQGEGGRIAMAALDQVTREFAPDLKRVYLVGHSMGGNGSWYLAYNNPGRFAAVAPVCSFVNLTNPVFPPFVQGADPYGQVAQRIGKTPIFMVHGDQDRLVSVDESRKMAAALKRADGDYNYVEMAGLGHNTWDPTYRSEMFISWLFSQRLR